MLTLEEKLGRGKGPSVLISNLIFLLRKPRSLKMLLKGLNGSWRQCMFSKRNHVKDNLNYAYLGSGNASPKTA